MLDEKSCIDMAEPWSDLLDPVLIRSGWLGGEPNDDVAVVVVELSMDEELLEIDIDRVLLEGEEVRRDAYTKSPMLFSHSQAVYFGEVARGHAQTTICIAVRRAGGSGDGYGSFMYRNKNTRLTRIAKARC